MIRKAAFLLVALAVSALSQTAYLRYAPRVALPTAVADGNSPGFWGNGRLRVYTSTGLPLSMTGRDVFHLREGMPPVVNSTDKSGLWIEGVWRDSDGTVYAWYHRETDGGCAYKGLVTPVIGALVSSDGGRTFADLGIILSSGGIPNCTAQNGFFAGGHGDFSVVLDQQRNFFYFLFTNYSGDASSQGISVARMAFQDRASPVGAVYKYHLGEWSQPGQGGAVTPVYPAVTSWDRADTNSFWGPAVHWNTYLRRYVMMLNRSCCKAGWPQEGIYIAFSQDLANPAGWTAPRKLIDARDVPFAPAYYPQVFGAVAPETDSLVGEVGRLFMKGQSYWEIVFSDLPSGGDGDHLNRDAAAMLTPDAGAR